ncbi:MAG: family 78 glycoside hydrolase catalytic domain [Planctomycetota bacterium]
MKKTGDLRQLRLLNRRRNRLLSATVLLIPLLLSTRVTAANNAVSGPTIGDLRCEFMTTPLGIDDRQPALSWTIEDERRGVVQKSYRVLVATSEEMLARDEGDLWDSGEVASDCSHLVVYKGRPLVSRQRCFWKVWIATAAAGGDFGSGVWSEPSWWEMGLLEPEDWEGSWIESPVCRPIDNETTRLWTRMCLVPPERNEFKNDPAAAQAVRAATQEKLDAVLPAALFRTTFDVPATVKCARIYLCGLGFHEATLNGQPLSDHIHDPSVTQYKVRSGYVTHDIGPSLHSGRNELSVLVGGGYFHEPVVWGNPGQVDGEPCLRAQIELELADGRRQVFASDKSWQTTAGPLLKTHYWAGEAFDARRAAEWPRRSMGGTSEWISATEIVAPVPALVAQRCEPERIIRRLTPVAVHEPKPGIWVFDLGEMIVGTVELRLKAPAGTAVVLRTAEWTWNPKIQGPQFIASRLYYDEPGIVEWSEGMIAARRRGGSFLAPLGIEVDGQMRHLHPHLGTPVLVYVARGDAAGETWRPSFSLQPMRYIEVQGLETAPTLDTLTGLVVSSDEEVVGSFTCANPRFNDIFAACMNSTRYNTHGMSWDNAVERLQSQVYNAWSAPFASYLLWYPNLWRKVLEDQRLINRPEPGKGQAFANVVYGNRGGPGWATKAPTRMVISESVTVELPLQLCARYGDLRELRLHYPQMKAWLEACVDTATGDVRKGATTGGWNDHFYKETAADSNFEPGFDDEALMSMLLHGWLRETAAAARLLGKDEDAAVLEQTADRVRAHVNRTWYDAANKTYGTAEEKGSGRSARHDRFHGEYSVASGRSGRIDARYGWHGLMALAIATGVAPQQDIPAILDNCIADMREHYRGHHAAGHITHQLLYDVYSDHGMIETCYDMMNATGFPSFAYQLQSGNRTIPEGPAWTDRFPAFASACQNECQEPARWFTETLCGVSPDPAEPGFKHILLRPRIPTRLPSASLTTKTPYGELESSWKQESGNVVWTVRIPANSHATAYIPAESAEFVEESGRPLTVAVGCTVTGADAEGVQCRLGSGRYRFSFPAPVNAPSRLSELQEGQDDQARQIPN